ncbi:MAG: hypothetical protein RIS29_839 [Bacteroidota bacterium]
MLLTIMPGPDNIFVLTISLSQGKREGIFTSLGLAMGVLVHTIIAATGLAIVIKQSEFAFTGIKLCGAFYLFYMAYKALSEKRIEMSSESGNNSSPTLQLIQKGFLMNVLNPKVALFFIAFLPQFISHQRMSVTYQMFILGITFAIQAFLIFSIVAYLAGKLTHYMNSPRFWNITKWSKIIILTALGLLLILSRK